MLYCLSFFIIHAENINTITPFPLEARYHIITSWQTGYQAMVTLRNTTAHPTSSWTCSFTLGQEQSVRHVWNGALKLNGQMVTIANPLWIGGGIIPANAATTFGFIINNPQSTTPMINNVQATANDTSSPLPTPNTPTLNPILINTATSNSYKVSWSSVTNATSYTLQRATTSDFANTAIVAQGSMQSQIFTHQPNGTYFYRVSASNATGTSPFSNTQSIVINVTPP
jgi:hypothetical protein